MNQETVEQAAAAGVTVLTTGGTSDKVYFDANSKFEVGDSVIGDLLEQARVTVPVTVRELMRKDSLELDDADREQIHAAVVAAQTTAIVITHGTDTMTRTAAALAAVAGKTVVLTGSLAPARFAMTDAIFNVGLAFAAAQTCAPGIYIAMSGQIFAADRVRKNYDAQRFEAV